MISIKFLPPGINRYQASRMSGWRAAMLGIVSGLALPCFCQAQVSVSDEPPTMAILAQTTPGEPAGTIGWKNDSAADQWTGVTFHVKSDVVLDRITLGYSQVGTGVARAKVTVSIVQLGPEELGFSKRISTATIIQEESFTLPTTLPEKGYLSFDITDTPLAASDVPYAYVLKFEQPGNHRNFAFTLGKLDNEGSALILNEKSLVFRSDNGGQEYTNLLIRAVPVLFLQGSVKGAAGGSLGRAPMVAFGESR